VKQPLVQGIAVTGANGAAVDTGATTLGVGVALRITVTATEPDGRPLAFRFMRSRRCSTDTELQEWSPSNVLAYTTEVGDMTSCSGIVVGVRNDDGVDLDSGYFGDLQARVTLRVSDGRQPAAVAGVQLSVGGVEVDRLASFPVGTVITLTATGADPLGRPLQYAFYFTRSCSGQGYVQDWSASKTLVYTLAPEDVTSCTSIVVCVRNDDGWDYDSDLFGDHQYGVGLRVEDGTLPPVFGGVRVYASGAEVAEAAVLQPGETVTVVAAATDPRGLPLQYAFQIFRSCSGGGFVGDWSSSSNVSYTLTSADVTTCTRMFVYVRNNDAREYEGIGRGDAQTSAGLTVGYVPAISNIDMSDGYGRPIDAGVGADGRATVLILPTGATITIGAAASDSSGTPLEYNFVLVPAAEAAKLPKRDAGGNGIGGIGVGGGGGAGRRLMVAGAGRQLLAAAVAGAGAGAKAMGGGWGNASTITYTTSSADVCLSAVVAVRNRDGVDLAGELGDVAVVLPLQTAGECAGGGFSLNGGRRSGGGIAAALLAALCAFAALL
jgi:hypothetical protein